MKRMRDQNINTAEYWDERYRAGDHLWNAGDIIGLTAAQLRPGETVLDVGVGSAIIASGIARLVPGLTFYGCDISAVAINRLRARTDLGFQFERLFVHDARAPYEGLPIADAVVANELLEHMEDPEAVLTNLAGMARRAVVVSTPHQWKIRSPEHLWAFEEDDLLAMLARHGDARVWPARAGQNMVGVACKHTSKHP